LSHRKKTIVNGSRLIPRKHTETLVLLSVTYRNVAILQSLSHKPSFYDEWFASYDILMQFYPRGIDLGCC